jgi:hypothetical protein
MFQVFHTNIVKVDHDVAYVVMTIYVCFRCMFQMVHCSRECCIYICVLQAYVSSVFMCFIRMFTSVSFECCIYMQWFSNVFLAVFASILDTVLSVSSVFFCMLQLLLLDVLKVDRDVAHGMRVESGRWHRRRPRRCE